MMGWRQQAGSGLICRGPIAGLHYTIYDGSAICGSSIQLSKDHHIPIINCISGSLICGFWMLHQVVTSRWWSGSGSTPA